MVWRLERECRYANLIEEALKNTKEILEGKFKSSNKVVLEEFLKGEELSYFVIVDRKVPIFFLVQLKIIKELVKETLVQILEEWVLTLLHLYLQNKLEAKIKKKIIEPTLKAMKNLGTSL